MGAPRYCANYGAICRRRGSVPYLCVDCRVDTLSVGEFYMVLNDIWKATGVASNGGMLCIGCLEERLGRKLVPADFMDVPLNGPRDISGQRRSARLNDRLGLLGLIGRC